MAANERNKLERDHRCAVPIETEGKLVEVDLQVIVTDAMMRVPDPSLELPKTRCARGGSLAAHSWVWGR